MARQIELCVNSERVAELLDLSSDSVWCDEARDEWFSVSCRQIESLMPGVEVITAQGQRRLYSGWNGANTFTRKGGGAGTFADFTDEEWEQVESLCIATAERIGSAWNERELKEEIENLVESVDRENWSDAISSWKRLTEHHLLSAADPRITNYADAIEAAIEASQAAQAAD